MSYQSNGRHSRSSRDANFSRWLPLAITVTAAALGVAVWVWSELDDDESPPEEPTDNTYYPPQYEEDSHKDIGSGVGAYETAPPQPTQQESLSYMTRMSDVLRRTPSPQQIFDGASRSIVGGITAAGAVVGTALGSIIEEDRNAYKDHLTWSEEADARSANTDSNFPPQTIQKRTESIPVTLGAPGRNQKRKTIAIVLSADSYDHFKSSDGKFHGYAPVLSHLPQSNDFSNLRLFILIYAPLLKKHPIDAAATQSPILSFSNICFDETESPSSESEKLLTSAASLAFHSVYSQAIGLVEKETMVLPFTTSSGHIQILRHLKPEIIYLEENLCGNDGQIITQLQAWLHQDVVVIIDDEYAARDVTKNENKPEHADTENLWWKREEKVGKGSGVVLVKTSNIGDDWSKRVESKK
ncbi:hypothetical protein K3495_g3309 [Podosphaera aphanis]|nr:hypothetical protein K3495_g3309 [Podosphaera aphanis]